MGVVYLIIFPFVLVLWFGLRGLGVLGELLEFCIVCNFATDLFVLTEWLLCRLRIVDLRKFFNLSALAVFVLNICLLGYVLKSL